MSEPDYSDLPDKEFDWSKSIYGAIEEILPDAPEPLDNWVTLTHYVDANLMHDMVTGRSMTGILHLLNKTPVDWFSKKQSTVEVATYGSEFLAARTCVEQIVDLRIPFDTWVYLSVTRATCLGTMNLWLIVPLSHMESSINGITCSPSITSERLLPGVSLCSHTFLVLPTLRIF